MTFDEVLDQVRELLQQRGRVTYRSLKLRYQLDDELLAGVTDELIKAERVAADEDGEVLVWTGTSPVSSSTFQVSGSQPLSLSTQPLATRRQTLASTRPEAERRQLNVMFCDVVGSTALSERLDPEELREVVRAYQATCTGVIRRYDGHIAQHLGDGLLVYFGYPVAHEDDAQRAVRAGLEIIQTLQKQVPSLSPGEGPDQSRARQQAANALLPHGRGSEIPRLQVRIGIHTGLVVIGEIGSGEKREILALGETPNLAARLQGVAAPDTAVISAATQRLVQGLFACQDLGPQALKGITTPIVVYRVLGESGVQSRFEAAVQKGLTPLVGRAEELALLQRRWERAQAGEGQVVLLSGEPGIGKSRLGQEFKEQLGHAGVARIEFHCSPYHQNSALYPIIDHLQRLLQFAREDTPTVKLEKLQHTLSHYRFPQADTVPLLAVLLSLPHPEGYPPITVSPQKQKEKTNAALVAWLVEEAEQHAVYTTWEDLHWVDPSTLEVLTLIVDQAPTACLYVLLTFRPEFIPPWGNRSHLSQITLSRLGRPQVEVMVARVTGGKGLPPEVVQQIVVKTDGVPLFVEELTKTVLESVESLESVGSHDHRSLQAIAIPATLYDSLMARLDRLGPAKEIAQVGATLGREFSYELIHVVSPLEDETLQHGLKQLVEAELVYQRGTPPQAMYFFKHALIQDTAYQSLLKSTRQQYHRQIAQVLAERFPETMETQPELVAHHYTEAGLIEQALPYWRQAGERATQRSANAEAISHLTKGLKLLKPLPDMPARAQQELMLQIALGGPLMATKGWAAPEVEYAYTRALELCRQMGETPQLFPILTGLSAVYQVRGEQERARELGEQMLRLAQSTQHPPFLLIAHYALGEFLYSLGELNPSRGHLEQGIALYDPHKGRSRAFRGAQHPGVACLSVLASVLWLLGYPDQALQRSQEALTLAKELSHPFSLGVALYLAAWLHLRRREEQTAQERAAALMTLSVEQGFTLLLTDGTFLRGAALARQGKGEEGIAQMRQSLRQSRPPSDLAVLTEAYGKVGQVEEGLTLLAEALAIVDKTGERVEEAELYRLKGELSLQSAIHNPQSEITRTQHPIPSTQVEAEAEACFQKAIAVARRQSAKSLELRAVMSLARLWQQQGKKDEARQMLAEIYGWFTEGFETKDLQEAEALLEELNH